MAKAQVRELRMGTPFVNGSNLHQAMLKFAEVVGAASNGRIKINVYSDSQIGDIQALLSGMQLGTVDMAYLGIGNGASLKGGGPLNIAYTPYLFKSKEAADAVLNGPLFAPMFEELAEKFWCALLCSRGRPLWPRHTNNQRPHQHAGRLEGVPAAHSTNSHV